MNNFLDVLNKFLLANTDTEREALYVLLPETILEHKNFFYQEMFTDASQHTFFIITSLFIDWIFEIEDKQADNLSKEDSKFLGKLEDLFEYIDDEIPQNEQLKILNQTKEILSDYLLLKKVSR
ncbi:hypothetical protein BFQ30_08305 [Haemophilus quentini]|uniref:Uncharacterized protein n=1 Tax=Haemophilus quentini TaxID=123834 RepID=A0ABX3BP09_9PAST|nr:MULTISPECIES: hypothetical protein [Haemophilus]NYA48381.1 hypothetical protein [Haemophilus haemolyticus]OEY75835.1 hypothetical protein BFQ29_08650 [Haemophilus quentini]OEY76594.1 hypothetical protein BFQ30_08305 [Haemophilus quentini]ORC33813.1 hypothetical protein BES36_010110 [Haemophilus quentini]